MRLEWNGVPLSSLRGRRNESRSLHPMPSTGLRGLNFGDRDANEWDEAEFCDDADRADRFVVDAELNEDAKLCGDAIIIGAQPFGLPRVCRPTPTPFKWMDGA